MLTPTETAVDPAQPSQPLMEERLVGWHPGQISDRKLLELKTRLERVRTLGGAFARVNFSVHARQRLKGLLARAGNRIVSRAS